MELQFVWYQLESCRANLCLRWGGVELYFGKLDDMSNMRARSVASGYYHWYLAVRRFQTMEHQGMEYPLINSNAGITQPPCISTACKAITSIPLLCEPAGTGLLYLQSGQILVSHIGQKEPLQIFLVIAVISTRGLRTPNHQIVDSRISDCSGTQGAHHLQLPPRALVSWLLKLATDHCRASRLRTALTYVVPVCWEGLSCWNRKFGIRTEGLILDMYSVLRTR
jgi:hypothetical protein